MSADPAHERTPTARTRLFALLGDPVEHSLSPVFQNAALYDRELDGVYLTLQCSSETAPGLLRGIAEAGGGGNVTLPHKGLAAETVDVATEAVRQTGACNTFWLENGRVHGDNTDVIGFQTALRSLIGDPAGTRVLLLGAGGAAGAAAHALLEDRADAVAIFNRTTERATQLVEALGNDPRLEVLRSHPHTASERYDVIVNATSLGIRPDDPLPIDLERVAHEGAVFDIVYEPGGTAWTRSAVELGLPAADGSEMLLHQGAAAFERWWNQTAPIEAMRSALIQAHSPA